MLHKQHPLLEMARRAKRAGMSFETITQGLKPESIKHLEQMMAEYDRVRTRKS